MNKYRNFGPAAVCAGLFITALTAGFADSPGLELTVNVALDRHIISPNIYGMAYADPALAKEISLPLARWGGDATTRYNWKIDSSNAGDDWFFMANGSGKPSAGPDKLIESAKGWGGRVMLTIPIIDYISSVTGTDCSFPVSVFGQQQKTNPYVHPIVNGQQTDAGNGRTPDGKVIPMTKDQILRTNILNTPQIQGDWVRYLASKFGPTAGGGVAMYEMDNEPGGWNNTHRDLHPGNLGHDELVNKTISYAAAAKAADPTALIVGPGDFMNHYQSDGVPGDGKAEHGGLGQGNYYLKQLHAYDVQHGVRLLDYFDEHFYPTAQDGQTDDTVLESTRSLWDTTYVEKNWIGKWQGPINLIPKFRNWVDQYYPGTKVSISEYGWGDVKTVIGTLAEADVLGIFARERLDMACLFGPPKAGDMAANAFRVYRNYDGQGSRFGDVYVQSTSSNQASLAIYGSQRTKDKTLTLVVINKTETDLTSPISITGFKPSAKAAEYQFTGGNPQGLSALPAQTITNSGFTETFPARSITLIAIPQKT
jgi:hypothetical protein